MTDLQTIAATVAPCYLPDDVPADLVGDQPHSILHAAPALPFDPNLAGPSRRAITERLVCVNNTAAGARILADAVIDAVDRTNTHRVMGASTPLADRTDPSRLLWSSTVEVVHWRGRA
jgi:hypothetical protein